MADGYDGMYVIGEMSWAAPGDVPGAERLGEYETAVNEVCATRPVTTLCQYDRRDFDVPRLTEFVGLHPKVVSTPMVFEMGLLRIVAVPSGSGAEQQVWLRLSGEADVSAGDALEQALVLAGASGTGDVHVDLADMRFIDVRAARQFTQAARGLRSDRRLVLHNAPPVVRRLIGLCWPALTGLEVANV